MVQEPRFKVWRIAADDEKVRDSHLAANGQVRFTGEPFRVGDAALMEPRDPNGPPEETFNCRCTKEEYSLSDLPKDLLAQIEHRLTEEQRHLARGILMVDAGNRDKSREIKGNEEVDSAIIPNLKKLRKKDQERIWFLVEDKENKNLFPLDSGLIGGVNAVLYPGGFPQLIKNLGLDPEQIRGVFHNHINKDFGSTTANNEWKDGQEVPGPADILAIIQLGVPNYFITPRGNIKAVEQIDGVFSLRDVIIKVRDNNRVKGLLEEWLESVNK